MKPVVLSTLFLCFSLVAFAQETTIPAWFTETNETLVGTWIASNQVYMSEEEPYVAYGIEWKYALGKTALVGRLFGRTAKGEEQDFWEFRQYWDNEKKEARILQFGYGNVIGDGVLSPSEGSNTQSIQTFSLPDGRTWKEKHHTTFDANKHQTTSFEWKEEAWKAQRSYEWIKQTAKG